MVTKNVIQAMEEDLYSRAKQLNHLNAKWNDPKLFEFQESEAIVSEITVVHSCLKWTLNRFKTFKMLLLCTTNSIFHLGQNEIDVNSFNNKYRYIDNIKLRGLGH